MLILNLGYSSQGKRGELAFDLHVDRQEKSPHSPAYAYPQDKGRTYMHTLPYIHGTSVFPYELYDPCSLMGTRVSHKLIF